MGKTRKRGGSRRKRGGAFQALQGLINATHANLKKAADKAAADAAAATEAAIEAAASRAALRPCAHLRRRPRRSHTPARTGFARHRARVCARALAAVRRGSSGYAHGVCAARR